MKITLIQPPKPRYGVQAEDDWVLARPFSLFFLAASIEKHTQYEVQIVDLEQRKYRNIPLKTVFGESNSQIYGITATTLTRYEAVKIAKYIKKSHPDVMVIAGGVHFMHCAEDTLNSVPEIDIVVRGEGEIIIVELANAICRRQNIEHIKGITYRKDGKIAVNQDEALVEDLDGLPYYSKFSWDEYPEYLFGYPERIRAISVMSSRGCPFNCVFCTKAGMKYRVRNAKNIVDEIQNLMDKFDVAGVNFLDLTFTADSNHLTAVCNEMINRRLNLKWWCESRANISLDLLDIMKRAGCVSTVVGVESGSPRILSAISKNISLDQVLAFCRKCSDLEIFAIPYFMFSLPGEKKRDLKLTLDLIIRLEKLRGIGPCAFQPTLIMPGTEIERISYKRGFLKKGFSWYEPYYSDFNVKLGQLPNIPLFIDKLNPDKFIKVLKELELRRKFSKAEKLGLRDLIRKGINLLRRQPSSLKYVFSPKYYCKFIVNKIKEMLS
ncbi:MAG: radical SAM protein [bacterium]|nr:radical SAM protein [bacterium]